MTLLIDRSIMKYVIASVYAVSKYDSIEMLPKQNLESKNHKEAQGEPGHHICHPTARVSEEAPSTY